MKASRNSEKFQHSAFNPCRIGSPRLGVLRMDMMSMVWRSSRHAGGEHANAGRDLLLKSMPTRRSPAVLTLLGGQTCHQPPIWGPASAAIST